ncbi:MAG: hypothetical protein K5871_10880 [Lachnospiraceae bacterium]|nr:hypothetical protein [Lachnospiraceae bacterium]
MNGHDILLSILYSLIACAFLPVLGKIIDIFVVYIFGGILTLILRDRNRFVFFYNFLTIPGVVYHELSHALMAVITGARVDSVSLFEPKDNQLGEVIFTPRGTVIMQAIQMSLVSCAPVITGIAGLTWSFYYVLNHPMSAWKWILMGYLMLCVFMHMTMSMQDIINYLKGIPAFLILFFLFFMFVRPRLLGPEPMPSPAEAFRIVKDLVTEIVYQLKLMRS